MGQQAGVWCCNCPKCLSTFILLFPFVGPKRIERIFLHNLYEDERLINLLDSLISEDRVKPFECVGTPEEVKEALKKILTEGEFNENILIKHSKIL